MNVLKRKGKISRNQSENSAMSSKTKGFLQKICYKKTASIDMTQYGFVNNSKVHPVNLLIKPLRNQLEKICGKPNHSEMESIDKYSRKCSKGSSSPKGRTTANSSKKPSEIKKSRKKPIKHPIKRKSKL